DKHPGVTRLRFTLSLFMVALAGAELQGGFWTGDDWENNVPLMTFYAICASSASVVARSEKQ
ncbi:MAG TPA: hypothetical protein VJ984_04290, partial [Xanthomonadales bacterium]|nr:hypothetical protein [Xanthomonadales bacterium]